MGDVLLVVSAELQDRPAAGAGPRKDYRVLASALDADVLDRSSVARSAGGRLIERAVGPAVAQAWLAFRLRRRYASIVTDGEHIGIPLALLLKLARASTVHVTIGHRISALKKRPFLRWLRVHTHIARIVLHSRRQREIGVAKLSIPAERLPLVPYQVDTEFWRPQPVPEERLVCSAGLEYRDYPTLFEAVEGLDARVVVGAASHWSRRPNTALRRAPPANVTVGAFDYVQLRELYARAAVVVVALEDIDFQAGLTTMLEAMAMAKPVIVTHTWGQTDVVQDRRAITRAIPPRARPMGLVQLMAKEAGVEVEPNGLYVPPRDAAALRRAIVYLLDHANERAQLGAAGRRAAERFFTIERFAERMRAVVEAARLEGAPSGSPQRPLALLDTTRRRYE